MGFFPFIVAAALLPAVFIAAGYFISFRRIPDDHEIRARKRWKLASRGNAVFFISVIGGLIGVAEGCRNLPAVAKILISCLFILITFTPFMIVLGAIDRRLREIEFPLGGYIKFQYVFFFGRWSSVLVIVAFLLLPVGLTGPDGGVSFTGVGVMIGGAALFILCSLYQMRIVGRLTGALVPAGPDDGPAGDIARLSEKAGVKATKVLFMETFGYPFYNAFAAPGKIIYITRPLLGALSREELSAIAAHEIGHLTTMKGRTAFILAILTVCVVALWFLAGRIPRLLSDINSFFVEIVVALVFFLLAVFSLGAASRRFEARADTAAAELTGGPDPMIAALEKIYRLGMLPRRFDKKGSENASHPSLERRVAQLKGENLPKAKRKVGILLLVVISVLVLVGLRLLSYYGERSIAPAYPGNSYGDVLGSFEERLAQNPNNFETLKRLAIEYYSIEEDKRALEMIDRALAVKRDPGLLMLKGIILDWWGERDEALTVIEEAYREGAGPQALRWAAALAVDLGDTKKARDYLSALRTIDPQDPYAEMMKRYLSENGGEYPFLDYYPVFQGTGRWAGVDMHHTIHGRKQ